MNQSQFFETLTVQNAAGNSAPLRYSFGGSYQAAGVAPAAAPPTDAPWLSVRRGNAPRAELKTHRGDYVYPVPLTWTIHQSPGAHEEVPDPAAAFALFRKLLMADASVDQGDLGYIFIPPLKLESWLEPQENPASGGLLGRIVWLERVQLHAP